MEVSSKDAEIPPVFDKFELGEGHDDKGKTEFFPSILGLEKKEGIQELEPLKTGKESLATSMPPGGVGMTTELEVKVVESHGEEDRAS